MDKLEQLKMKMIEYNEGIPLYIQHLLKVHSFARLIGISEGLDERTQFLVETAALVHDIGIRPSDEKYGEHRGPLQEKEGPAPARRILSELGYDEDVIERVCYLVAHHHTYTNVEGIDYRILLEADFLVNLYEEESSEDTIKAALEKIFRTASGIQLCKTMFRV